MAAAMLNLTPDTPRQFRRLVDGVIQVHLDDINSMLRIRPTERGGRIRRTLRRVWVSV